MLVFRLIGVAAGLLVLVTAAGPAWATTLYVAPSGSGTSACASSEPCSAGRADALVGPGDTVQVAPGTYDAFTLTRGGTSAARVSWVSETRWGAHVPNVNITASAPYVTFQGFDVGGSAGTLVGVDASYSRIVGNHVHNSASDCASGGGGIALSGFQDGYNGVGGEVLGNLVEDIGAGPRNGTCRTFHGIASSMPEVRIINNLERRALGFGIHLWHAARNNTIVNNTVTENGASGILIGAGDLGATGLTPSVSGNFVANNIVASNVELGITECCDDTPGRGPNRYASNLGWRNGGGNSDSTLVGNVMGGGTVSNSLYADPQFVGPADYHLQPASPAIDSGTSANAPATDLDGTTRPQGDGVDRGAYEVPAGPGGQPGDGSSGGGSGGQQRAVNGVRIAPRRVRMSRQGTVRLRVTCPGRERRCDVWLRLRLERKTVAARRFSVRGGASRRVTLKLSRGARRELVRRRSLRVVAVASVRTRAGHRGTTRTSILLLAPRRD